MKRLASFAPGAVVVAACQPAAQPPPDAPRSTISVASVTASAPSPAPPPEASRGRNDALASHVAFRWKPGTLAPAEDGSGARRYLVVVNKEDGTERQTLAIEVDDLSGPTVPTDDAQIGDYNFDGSPDVAVPMDHGGPYGSRTYAVLLYDQGEDAFRHAKAFSRLTWENIGLFRVDGQAQRLTVFSKSGCCIHFTHSYEVDDDALTLVHSETREHGANGTCTQTVRTRLPDGDFKEATSPCPP